MDESNLTLDHARAIETWENEGGNLSQPLKLFPTFRRVISAINEKRRERKITGERKTSEWSEEKAIAPKWRFAS